MLKHLTTLDFLSGSRIVTAVAAGWLEREFETLGASFQQRGKLLDEWLRAAFLGLPADAGPRGRHAIAGPPDWVAERLVEYLAAGSDGFVLNLDYGRRGLEERVRRFADEVVPLLPQRASSIPLARPTLDEP